MFATVGKGRMLDKMEKFDPEKVINEFEELTKNAGKVQQDTLKKILEENADAEYLQKLGLNGRTDPESYRRCVPIVSHNDLEPYIQRIMDGDSSPILTGKPVPNITLRYFDVSSVLLLLCLYRSLWYKSWFR